MNLIQLANELRQLKNQLVLKGSSQANGNTVQISQWMNTSNALNRLKDYSFLNDEVMKIFSINDSINLRMDSWSAHTNTYNELNNKIGALRESIEACLKLIAEYTGEKLEIPEGRSLINTKMPDNIDMEKMARICGDLNKVFNQCPLISDEIKFVGVEKGSVFFVFTTTIVAAVVLGKILEAALEVQKKYYQNRILKNKLESMQNLTEHTAMIIKELDDEVKEYCKDKAKAIEGSDNLDNEQNERLVLTIKTLSELVGQGVQMQCILSENQQDTEINFPKLEDFKVLQEGIKMVTGN